MFESVIRVLTSRERMAYKINMRAHQAFLEHGLHRTELGTGVHIIISLLEHRIEVLTDHPILDQIPQRNWDDMVEVVRNGFQKGNPVESLCHAIATCGNVLTENFPVDRRKPNPNELPNDLIGDI